MLAASPISSDQRVMGPALVVLVPGGGVMRVPMLPESSSISTTLLCAAALYKSLRTSGRTSACTQYTSHGVVGAAGGGVLIGAAAWLGTDTGGALGAGAGWNTGAGAGGYTIAAAGGG